MFLKLCLREYAMIDIGICIIGIWSLWDTEKKSNRNTQEVLLQNHWNHKENITLKHLYRYCKKSKQHQKNSKYIKKNTTKNKKNTKNTHKKQTKTQKQKSFQTPKRPSTSFSRPPPSLTLAEAATDWPGTVFRSFAAPQPYVGGAWVVFWWFFPKDVFFWCFFGGFPKRCWWFFQMIPEDFDVFLVAFGMFFACFPKRFVLLRFQLPMWWVFLFF